MDANTKEHLTVRQRVAVRLILFAVEIVKPWRYDHEAKDLLAAIKNEL